MIAPDDGRIPWWRVLWSLMGALLIGAVGWTALLFNNLAIASVGLPLLLPLSASGNLESGGSFWFLTGGSVVVWWAIMFSVLWWRWRKRGTRAAA